jgi:thiol-disulfide isomerase/thioredoxin
MTRHHNILILAIGLLLITNAHTQSANRTITGLITSSEELSPLEGVTVATKGGHAISGSQSDGIYYISVAPSDSILVFSYPDFQTRELRINSLNEYNISLYRAPKDNNISVPVQYASKNTSAFSPIGKWRGVFSVKQDLDIPFLFDITGNSTQDAVIYFLNAEERFRSGKITQMDDSLFITLDPFDNELAFKTDENVLTGVLRRQDTKSIIATVKAERGKGARFAETGVVPTGNLTGTYDIFFKNTTGADEKAVGLFTQDGNKVKATFLRVTGDSRYLEGIVEGNNFYLSSFIGGNPVYYKGSLATNGTIAGEAIGPRGGQAFTGIANQEAALPDPYKLTFLKQGYTSLDFSFPNLAGKKISPADAAYKNKVLIITITGSWCPNCIDEAAFLAPWYKKNKSRGVEAIAIHYERQTDPAYVQKALSRFSKQFDIQYEEVIGGIADKQYVASSLPALNTFLAFPTIIFIDKKGQVAKIYTGYTGPATGKHYTQFVKEFNEEVDRLLKK